MRAFGDSLPLADAPDSCPVCDGTGGQSYTEGDCCGRYLATGECCAALYGTANLVPVERMEPCPACGGSGVAP